MREHCPDRKWNVETKSTARHNSIAKELRMQSSRPRIMRPRGSATLAAMRQCGITRRNNSPTMARAPPALANRSAQAGYLENQPTEVEMKLNWNQFEAVFGRKAVQPDDYLVVNDGTFVVGQVDADGVTLDKVEGDDDAEKGKE